LAATEQQSSDWLMQRALVFLYSQQPRRIVDWQSLPQRALEPEAERVEDAA